MRAIKFVETNIIFAEKQDEYASLPGYAQLNGIATFNFKLSPKEMGQAIEKGKIYIGLVCFDNPMMPIKVSVDKPEMPVHVVGFESTPDFFIETQIFMETLNRVAYKIIKLEGEDMKKLAKTREIWLSVSTFGTALQPIALSCNEPEEIHIDATKPLNPNKPA